MPSHDAYAIGITIVIDPDSEAARAAFIRLCAALLLALAANSGHSDFFLHAADAVTKVRE